VCSTATRRATSILSVAYRLAAAICMIIATRKEFIVVVMHRCAGVYENLQACAMRGRNEEGEARQVPAEPRSNSNLPYTSFVKVSFQLISIPFTHQGLCTKRCKTFASNAAAAQRLLLIVKCRRHHTLSSQLHGLVCPVLRDETCTSMVNLPPPGASSCKQRMLRGFDARRAQAQAQAQAQGPLRARPANDLHGLRCISTRTVSTPGRLSK
jgi:hypothetical protein